jgi:hypothetical protein
MIMPGGLHIRSNIEQLHEIDKMGTDAVRSDAPNPADQTTNMPQQDKRIKRVTIIIEADTLRLLQQQLRVLGCTYSKLSGWHEGPLPVGIFVEFENGTWFTSITNGMHLDEENLKWLAQKEIELGLGPPEYECIMWDSEANSTGPSPHAQPHEVLLDEHAR